MKKNIHITKSFAIAAFMMLCFANANAQVLFYEPFNATFGQMTANSGVSGGWQYNNTCPGSTQAGHTGPGTAMFIGAGCQFGNGGSTVSGNMDSPDIIVGAAGATLTFKFRINTECGANICTYDVVSVIGSTDNFATSTTLVSTTSGLIPNGTVWGTATIPLAAFTSTTMKLRFNYNSIDGIANAVDGVYIDDIMVQEPSSASSFTGLPTSVCANGSAVTLVGTPAGGIFSGNGAGAGSFDPAIAGAGVHAITYTAPGNTYSVFTGLPLGVIAGSGTNVSLGDDVVSALIPVGFSFTYWGVGYTGLYLSSNGFLTFNNDPNSACCSGGTIPTAGSPDNIISGSWNDLNGGSRDYFTTGTAPNRILCVNYTGVPHFGGGGTPVVIQYQLYEATGVVEIHSTNNVTDGSNQTMGLENATGSLGVAVTGRNASATFNVVNEMTRFVPTNTSVNFITVNGLPTVTGTPATSTVCSGSSVTLSGAGASSYSWTGGITNGSAFPATATTTYTVTGTDGNGCTNTSSAMVTVNALPTVTAASDAVAAVCAGTMVTLTGGGATSYTWDNGVTDAVAFAATATTTYMVTGTDVNSCTNTAMVTVTVTALPTVTANSTASAVCAGGMVTLNGGGAVSYAWDNGVTDAAAFAPSATTTYMVTGTDGNSCTNTSSTTVTVNALPTVTANTTASTVCAGDMVTLNGGGAATYVWDNGVTDAVAFAATATTTYMVTGTDVNSCTNMAMVTVTVNALPIVTANTTASTVCAGDMVTLTGGGATSYTWDNGVTDAVAFAATATTTYMVTGTDANSCSNMAMVTVTVNSLPTVTATSDAVAAVCEGTMVTLTGGGATTYTWDNGVTDAVAFAATATTTYIVTGTDINSCSNTAMVTVTVNALPTVTATSDAIAAVCEGTMVTLTGGGATTYTWDNGVTDAVAFAATATTIYMVTGTDINSCSNTAMVTVTVNALPTITANSTASAVCTGGMVTLTGGGAVSYTWDNGVTDAAAFTPTATTTYIVTGTDVNSCSNTASTTVTVNALPTVTANSTASVVCAGDIVTLTGGGAVSYTWDNGVTDAVAFAPVATGTYIVTGTDVNSCTNTALITVTVNVLPAVTLSSFTSPICLQAAASTLTGGSPAGGVYSGTGVSAGMFDPAVAGVGVFAITYTVTDINSCTNSSSSNITVQDCSGIEENVTSLEVNVYPNPTSGTFNVTISNANFSELVITIVDIQGKEVFTSSDKNISGVYNKEISLKEISKGLYYIKANTGSDMKIQKLIIQ